MRVRVCVHGTKMMKMHTSHYALLLTSIRTCSLALTQLHACKETRSVHCFLLRRVFCFFVFVYILITHCVVHSCELDLGLQHLLVKIWEYLNLVRVYTKVTKHALALVERGEKKEIKRGKLTLVVV